MRHVYVMGPRDGLYKIGFSACPAQRAAAIGGTATPVPIVLSVPCEWATKLERYLHQAFHHRRVHGEWFRLTEKDLATLQRLRFAHDVGGGIPQAIQRLHKSNEKVGVQIAGRIWKQLNTIWNLKRDMGERFDSFQFLDGIIRGPIAELLEATQRERDERWARMRERTKQSRPAEAAA